MTVLHRVLIFACCLAPPAAAGTLSESTTAFTASSPTESARTQRQISESVQRRFDELDLAAYLRRAPSLDGGELDAVFTAMHHAMFYTSKPSFLARMERVFALLEQREAATDAHFASMQRAYVQLRRFDAANRLATDHPGRPLQRLPEFSDPLGPHHAGASEWRFNEAATELTRAPLDLRSIDILVVSHPQCGYSQRAVADISRDEQLHALFRVRSHWLAPQDGRLTPKVHADWNATHPDHSLAIVHRASELPEVDTWSTPTFYFLRDGAVVAKVIGWPKGGRRDELLAAARKAALAER